MLLHVIKLNMAKFLSDFRVHVMQIYTLRFTYEQINCSSLFIYNELKHVYKFPQDWDLNISR